MGFNQYHEPLHLSRSGKASPVLSVVELNQIDESRR